MIKLENTEVHGWKTAIRGMRNPMNSWEKSDSDYCGRYMYCSKCPAYGESEYDFCRLDSYSGAKDYKREDDPKPYVLGLNDRKLALSLADSGSVHAKYRRMITVYVDITAPLYWWKEFDTYKVGTVANSCSTMHKIHAKEFTLKDFSCEHLIGRDVDWEEFTPKDFSCEHLIGRDTDWKDTFFDLYNSDGNIVPCCPTEFMKMTCDILNFYRKKFLETKDKKYWWQMIQLLPSSYNQRRTVMMNYEVLAGIYPMRKDHKLDEWNDFCHWIKGLPYSEIIIGKVGDTKC